jgi:crossover junction endodeoxyribonuclease RuvC
MISLGIDPGSHRLGYAFLEKLPGSRTTPKVLDYGTIEVPPKTPSPANLLIIQDSLSKLIQDYKPNRACVENLFFSKNKKTAQQVYEARGVILLTLGQHEIPIFELTANQIKKGVSATGSADKKAIRRSIQMILGMTPTGHDDSWDAIACAFVGASL